MAEASKDTTTEQRQLEPVRADVFAKFYANSARVETTLWDMKIFFGEVVLGGSKPFIEEFASIAMSPQHAKALISILIQNVNEYESLFGPIPSLPESGPKETPRHADASSKKR